MKVIDYLEDNSDSLSTISDLVKKMKSTGLETFSRNYMKIKLHNHYGSLVVMTSLSTKECVVILRETASSILYAYHQQQKNGKPENDKLNIIQSAAKLIVSDVKSIDISTDSYPSTDSTGSMEFAVDYIPDTLQTFLRTIFAAKYSDIKFASIGHAIIQAIRPSAVLAPLQLGLGVKIHHHFGSL